jgi:hypothetical protein
MPGVTQAQFARMMGVSDVAVLKAVRSGRITKGDDGLIDPDTAARDWVENRRHGGSTPPIRPQAIAIAAASRAAQPPKPPPAPPVPPQPKPEARPTIQTAQRPAPQRPAPPSDEPAEGPTMVRLQKAELGLKLEERKLRLDREKGRLIDRAKAVAMVRRLAQEERDAILNWPGRVAAVLAAELGADPHKVQTMLERSLREHLAARGEPNPRLA